jgi:pyruvate dehydrogenase complex dehydrogenase (E1) component
MQQLAACLDHEILSNQNMPGQILVVSHWTSDEAAHVARDRYASHPNAVSANELASSSAAIRDGSANHNCYRDGKGSVAFLIHPHRTKYHESGTSGSASSVCEAATCSEHLRKHCEVNAESIAASVLGRLVHDGKYEHSQARRALSRLSVDPEKLDPFSA